MNRLNWSSFSFSPNSNLQGEQRQEAPLAGTTARIHPWLPHPLLPPRSGPPKRDRALESRDQTSAAVEASALQRAATMMPRRGVPGGYFFSQNQDIRMLDACSVVSSTRSRESLDIQLVDSEPIPDIKNVEKTLRDHHEQLDRLQNPWSHYAPQPRPEVYKKAAGAIQLAQAEYQSTDVAEQEQAKEELLAMLGMLQATVDFHENQCPPEKAYELASSPEDVAPLSNSGQQEPSLTLANPFKAARLLLATALQKFVDTVQSPPWSGATLNRTANFSSLEEETGSSVPSYKDIASLALQERDPVARVTEWLEKGLHLGTTGGEPSIRAAASNPVWAEEPVRRRGGPAAMNAQTHAQHLGILKAAVEPLMARAVQSEPNARKSHAGHAADPGWMREGRSFAAWQTTAHAYQAAALKWTQNHRDLFGTGQPKVALDLKQTIDEGLQAARRQMEAAVKGALGDLAALSSNCHEALRHGGFARPFYGQLVEQCRNVQKPWGDRLLLQRLRAQPDGRTELHRVYELACSAFAHPVSDSADLRHAAELLDNAANLASQLDTTCDDDANVLSDRLNDIGQMCAEDSRILLEAADVQAVQEKAARELAPVADLVALRMSKYLAGLRMPASNLKVKGKAATLDNDLQSAQAARQAAARLVERSESATVLPTDLTRASLAAHERTRLTLRVTQAQASIYADTLTCIHAASESSANSTPSDAVEWPQRLASMDTLCRTVQAEYDTACAQLSADLQKEPDFVKLRQDLQDCQGLVTTLRLSLQALDAMRDAGRQSKSSSWQADPTQAMPADFQALQQRVAMSYAPVFEAINAAREVGACSLPGSESLAADAGLARLSSRAEYERALTHARMLMALTSRHEENGDPNKLSALELLRHTQGCLQALTECHDTLSAYPNPAGDGPKWRGLLKDGSTVLKTLQQQKDHVTGLANVELRLAEALQAEHTAKACGAASVTATASIDEVAAWKAAVKAYDALAAEEELAKASASQTGKSTLPSAGQDLHATAERGLNQALSGMAGAAKKAFEALSAECETAILHRLLGNSSSSHRYPALSEQWHRLQEQLAERPLMKRLIIQNPTLRAAQWTCPPKALQKIELIDAKKSAPLMNDKWTTLQRDIAQRNPLNVISILLEEHLNLSEVAPKYLESGSPGLERASDADDTAFEGFITQARELAERAKTRRERAIVPRSGPDSELKSCLTAMHGVELETTARAEINACLLKAAKDLPKPAHPGRVKLATELAARIKNSITAMGQLSIDQDRTVRGASLRTTRRFGETMHVAMQALIQLLEAEQLVKIMKQGIGDWNSVVKFVKQIEDKYNIAVEYLEDALDRLFKEINGDSKSFIENQVEWDFVAKELSVFNMRVSAQRWLTEVRLFVWQHQKNRSPAANDPVASLNKSYLKIAKEIVKITEDINHPSRNQPLLAAMEGWHKKLNDLKKMPSAEAASKLETARSNTSSTGASSSRQSPMASQNPSASAAPAVKQNKPSAKKTGRRR